MMEHFLIKLYDRGTVKLNIYPFNIKTKKYYGKFFYFHTLIRLTNITVNYSIY